MTLDVQAGLTLRLKFSQDRILHYALKTSVSQEMIDKGTVLGKEQNAFQSQMTQRVVRVEEDGSGHLVMVSEPTGEVGPIPIPGAPATREVSYTQMDPRGEIVEITGLNPGSSYSFPEGPVKEGEAWHGETRLHVPMRPGPVLGENVYTLAGTEVVGGYHCVKIEVVAGERNFEVPLPDGSGASNVVIRSQGTMWFAPDGGFLVKLDMITHSVPVVGDVTFDTTNHMLQELVRVEQAGA